MVMSGEFLSLEIARRMIEAAEKKAKDIGVPVSVAVVDSGGHLKAFARMDNCSILTIEVAINKAYTAGCSGIASDEWYEIIKNDPAALTGLLFSIPRLVIFEGGLPIKVEGKITGGVGVSGGFHTQDTQIAQAALDALKPTTPPR